MAIVVEFDNLGEKVRATVHNRVWTCDDPLIMESLQSCTRYYEYELGTHIPDPDRTLVEYIIADLTYFHGRIISAPPPPRNAEGAIEN